MSQEPNNSHQSPEKKVTFNNIIERETNLNNKINNINIEKDVRAKFRNTLDKNIELEPIDVVMQNLRKKRALKQKLKLSETN
tara:strand:- start:2031 stop:2276 length:246 start_codon:yes stop_codon:yes gene_type:complete